MALPDYSQAGFSLGGAGNIVSTEFNICIYKGEQANSKEASAATLATLEQSASSDWAQDIIKLDRRTLPRYNTLLKFIDIYMMR
jgi:hypothetical protein